MNEIIVREATKVDFKEIQQIYQYYVLNSSATAELVIPDEEEMLNRWYEVKKAGFPYLVAIMNQSIVGYAYVSPYSPRGGFRYSAIWSVYIKKEFKAKGIGHQLLKKIELAIQPMNIQRLIGTVSGSNQESILFHKKNGFEQIGCFPNAIHKFNQWHDLIWMLKNFES